MSAGNAQPISMPSSQSAPTQQITIYLNPAVPTSNDHSHHIQQQQPPQQQQHQQPSDHHQLLPPKIGTSSGETYQISPMQPVSSSDLQQAQQSFIHVTTHNTVIPTTPTAAAAVTISSSSLSSNANATPDQNQNINPQEQPHNKLEQHDQQVHSDQSSPSATRFKWTEEKSQVAMNLVKYGCKPKLISVAVGCSLRTAQKFAETVTPKIEGESFKTYQIKRRGRKSKDVNQRLNAIREVLSKNSSVTQVEIAADLKVSNTTVCRDLKRLGTSWKEKKNGNNTSGNSTLENINGDEQSTMKSETSSQQMTTARKTRQANSKTRNNNNNNNTNDNTKSTTKTKRQRRNTKTNNTNNNNISINPDNGQDHLVTNSVEVEVRSSN